MGFIISIIIGAIAGWLAGLIVKGDGQGVIMNIVVGVLGAVLAGWLFPALGWNLGAGPATGATVQGTSFFGSIVFSTIGAVLLLLIVSLVTGRRRG